MTEVPWCQLSYASSDGDDATPGGWQIQGQRPADMDEAIRSALRTNVVTRLVELVPPDELADRAELEARTRRLAFRPLMGGLAWWHAASAGQDATGRPGNVFTHSVLLTGEAGTLRPIDLWRSPDWLAPFGAGEVKNASLGDFAGQPGPLTREVAVDWIQEHAEELEPLVAAVSWAFAEPEQRRVILATDSVDEFAAWISAVSYLTAAVLSRQIPFVTFERTANGVGDIPATGLVGVPSKDVTDLREAKRPDTLVLVIGDLPVEPVEDRWEYGGQSWPVDQIWQDALYGASGLTADELLRVLEGMDEIMAPLAEGEIVSPGWPLALAMLKVAPERVQEKDRLLAEWRRRQPWDGLRDAELSEMFGATPIAEDPLESSVGAPEQDQPTVDLTLVAAAARLVEFGESASPAERTTVERCIHLMLTHALPEDEDSTSAARAAAYLDLGDQLTPGLRDLLVRWKVPSPGTSQDPHRPPHDRSSHG